MTLLVIVVCSASTGCASSEESILWRLRLLCDWTGDCCPDGVAPELRAVEADPQRYSEEGHPLAEAAVGTVIDDLDGLAGCWGRRSVVPAEDAETGMTIDETRVEVLRFDADQGLLTEYWLLGWPEGSVPAALNGSSSSVVTYICGFQMLSENRISQTINDGFGGAVTAGGRIVFTPFIMGVLVSLGNEWESYITLQGEYLRIDEFGSDDEAGETSLWRRLDCAGQ